MHVVRHHQTGDLPLRHNLSGQMQHLLCRRRIECCRVLIQKKNFRRDHRRHEKCECLPLTAGEKSHRLLHTVFQSHVKQRKLLSEFFLIRRVDPAEICIPGGCRPKIGKRHVFLDRHVRRRSL